MIDTSCPHCRTPYRLKPELAGRQVKCRVCQVPFTVDEPEIADVDLMSVEMPAQRMANRPFAAELPSTKEFSAPMTRPAPAQPRPAAKPVRKGPKVDELGFFVDDDDDDHVHVRPGRAQVEPDPHDEAELLREAARKGAESLYEPRKPRTRAKTAAKQGPNAASIVIRLGLGVTAIAAAGVLIYFGVRMISNAGIRAALAGLPYEIQAEFEQEGDTPIGSPAPPEARIDKTLQVRDLSKHRNLLKDMIADFNAMGDAIAQINDANSAEAQKPRIEDISKRLQGLQARVQTEKIFDPNPKEDQILAKEFGKPLRAAGERIRDQLRRIQSMSSFPLAMSGAMSQVNFGLSQMERQFISKGELAPHESYAEIRVAGLKNKEERDYVREMIMELATPRSSSTKTASLAATRYAIWPVESVSQLSKKITFGKVIRTSGKEIWVIADPIDPQILKERLAKREADEAENKKRIAEAEEKAKEARKAFEDVEVPADADYITRALLIATKSKNFVKKRDGLNMLKAASDQDLAGREDEILEALKIPLTEANPFDLKEMLIIVRRLNTPKRLETLLNRLNIQSGQDDVIEAIGELKDPASIEPLAKFMSQDDWGNVDKILIAFGPAAEKAVIGQLTSTNDRVRDRACKILAEIGTEESLNVMKKLPADSSFFVRTSAVDAMRAIQLRQRLKGDSGTDKSSKEPGTIRIEPNKKSGEAPKSSGGTPPAAGRSRPG